MSAALYVPLIEAVRRTGLPAEELGAHVIVIDGEPRVSVATVERIRQTRLPLAREEQARYARGEMEAGERKF
jgi:hypothetical protein